eukprot:15470205-Alexandrium_andersonii.AAC.1
MAELLCDAMGIEVKPESARTINDEIALTFVDVDTVHDDRLKNFLDALDPGEYAPNDLQPEERDLLELFSGLDL